MIAHEINKLDNFMGGWYMEDTSICDRIVEYYHKSPDKQKGMTYFESEGKVIPEAKQSTDVKVWPDELRNDYYGILKDVVNRYKEKYPCCTKLGSWAIRETLNIQHYDPSEAFHHWHCERSSGVEPMVTRVLAFMTYLNDVTDAGETEFLHQKLKIKPEKGLTVIWPADWMFYHRGIPSPTQEKIIVTSWFNLLPMS
jgi:hypothetical protein